VLTEAFEANMTPSGSEVFGSLKLQILHPFRVLVCLKALFVVMSLNPLNLHKTNTPLTEALKNVAPTALESWLILILGLTP
jgi:hypothetical protein